MTEKVIYVRAEQPFASRKGLDEVLILRFPYNRTAVNAIKRVLHEHRAKTGQYNAGGFLPRCQGWFIEYHVWDKVKRELQRAGFTIEMEQPVQATNGGPAHVNAC